MELSFRGQLDLAALRRMTRAALRPSRRTLIVGAILALFMVWGVMVVPLTGGRPFADLLAELLPVLFVILVGGSVFVYGLFFNAPRKVLESNKLLQGELRGVVTEEGVHLETPHSRSDLPWEVFHRAKVGRDVVLLYQSVQVCNVFPREFFATEEDWQAFLALVRQRVSLKAPRRGKPLEAVILWLVIFLGVVLYYFFFDRGP